MSPHLSSANISKPAINSTRFARRLYLLSASSFLIFMGAGAQQAYLVPYLAGENGVTDWSRVAASGIIATVYFTMLIFRVVNIYLFPRWTDLTFTIVGSTSYVMFTVGMFAIAYLQSYTLALIIAFLWGIGASMMWTGNSMQTLQVADEAGGRHGTGIGILYSSTHAGWLLGAITLGMIYDALPPGQTQFMYLVASSIAFLGCILACFLPSTGAIVRETPSFAEFCAIVKRQRSLIAGFLQLTSAIAYGLILGVLGDYIEQLFGARWIWMSIGLYPATRMILSVVGGHFTDRIGQTPVLVTGFFVGAFGLLITVLWASPYSVLCAAFALGLLSSTVPVVSAAIVGDGAEKGRRPIVYGVLFAWRDLGVAATAIGANLLGLSFEFNTVFTVFIFVFIGCGLLSLYLGRFAQQRL